MPKIKLEGLDKLQKALKDNVSMDEVKKLVHDHGAQMHKKMQKNANFKGHYEWEAGKGKVFKIPTGATKDSIRLEIVEDGFAADSGATTEYAEYLEKGTRFMEAQPFVKPAFEDQSEKFKRGMQRLVK